MLPVDSTLPVEFIGSFCVQSIILYLTSIYLVFIMHSKGLQVLTSIKSFKSITTICYSRFIDEETEAEKLSNLHKVIQLADGGLRF